MHESCDEIAFSSVVLTIFFTFFCKKKYFSLLLL